jgi:hypothetical protein
MRRSFIVILPSILFLARSALAQPAPETAPPPEAAAPPAEPAPVPAAPPVATVPVIAPVPAAPERAAVAAPEATPAPSEPVLPPRVAVGKRGFWQPSAQLQFWAYGQSTEVKGEQDLTAGFRLRRAELRVKGEIVPKLFGFNVMVDPSRALELDTKKIPVTNGDPSAPSPGSVSVAQPSGPATILQDVILTFQSEYADVSVGQFKLPIGYEAYNSTAKLIMPEFALITRHYSARRDIGLKVEKKLGKHVYYRADLLNGAGQNRLDNDDQKDGGLRFEAYPIEGLVLGVAGYAGLNRRNSSATKDRIEGDLKLELGGALLQAEYIHGWDGATGDSDPDRTEGHGFYAGVGYKIADKLQPLVRVGHLNPHIGKELSSVTTANDRVWSYEAGANYFVEGYDLELQLSAGVFDYQHLASVYHGIFEVQVNF